MVAALPHRQPDAPRRTGHQRHRAPTAPRTAPADPAARHGTPGGRRRRRPPRRGPPARARGVVAGVRLADGPTSPSAGAVGAMQVLPTHRRWMELYAGRDLHLHRLADNATAGVTLLRRARPTRPAPRGAPVGAYYQGLGAVRGARAVRRDPGLRRQRAGDQAAGSRPVGHPPERPRTGRRPRRATPGTRSARRGAVARPYDWAPRILPRPARRRVACAVRSARPHGRRRASLATP